MQGVEHIPTEDSKKLVRNLAAMGTRYVDIAHKIDITDDTLRKHYKEELEGGRIDANAQIANTLFQQAKKGNMTAAIFWLKTRAGWKETQVTELTGAVDGIAVTFKKPDE
jgi:predicted transcriptional regulator